MAEDIKISNPIFNADLNNIRGDIVFTNENGLVIKITSDGFEFNGEIIKDAGRAYNAFMKFCNEAKYIDNSSKEVSNEESI